MITKLANECFKTAGGYGAKFQEKGIKRVRQLLGGG